jgi:hypothetical protein
VLNSTGSTAQAPFYIPKNLASEAQDFVLQYLIFWLFLGIVKKYLTSEIPSPNLGR